MKKIFLILALMLFIKSTILMAASGIASYNKLDISFRYDKFIENVTCVQDSNDKNKWYYVSNKPRLAESKNGNPMMKLITYKKNPKADIKNDGSIFQCGINLSLPTDVLPSLKKELAKVLDISESKIILAPLNMKNAKLMVYNPKGELLGNLITAPEIGSSFVNECIPIHMILNNLGDTFSEKLIKGTDGLQAYFLFDYDALTPENSVKITANYDKAFEHFSNDSKSANLAKKWFLLESQEDNILSTLRKNLTESETIEIESTNSEKLTDEQMDKLVQPVIEKLIKELYEIKIPQKIESGKSSDSKKELNKIWIPLRDNMILKNDKNRKTGEFVYDFRKHHIETRKNIVGGIINLSNYSEVQKKETIQAMDSNFWKTAYYSLPKISKTLNCVDEITLTVNFLYNNKLAEGTEKQLAKWNIKDGWLNAKKERCIGFEFPLQYFYEKYSDNDKNFQKNLIFQQNFEITYMEGNATKIKKFSTNVPAFTSGIPISTSMLGVTYIEFDANKEFITWDKSNYECGEYKDLKSNLTKIGIKVESKNPNNKAIITLTSKKPIGGVWFNNTYNKKTSIYSAPDISAIYTFYNSKLATAMNTTDKKTIIIEKEVDLSEGTSISIMDTDYMPLDKPALYK